MEASAILLMIAAVVPSTAALARRGGVRWPRAPVAELWVVAVLGAVVSVTVAEVQGQRLPDWAVALSMVAWLGFLLTFPSGRPTSRHLTVVAALAAVVIVAGTVVPSLREGAAPSFLIGFATLCAGQVWRYARRSSIAERQSTKWLVLGLLPALAVFLGLGLLSVLPAADPEMLTQPWYLVSSTLAMWTVPIAATAGLVLADRGPIDDLIRYGITATGTAFIAAATYLAMLSLVAPVWAAASACAVVMPSAWLFFRAGTALAYSRGPQRPIAELPARLAASPDPRRVGEAVAVTIREALGVPAAMVLVAEESLASLGDTEKARERTTVRFDGARVAELMVAPREGEAALSRRDLLILQRIALIAAPALRAAFAAREAEEARARLQSMRADERGRLHADLHDELGPALAGLGYTAKAAAHLLRDGPQDVSAMLASIERGTQALVRRVREISYDLRDDEALGADLTGILQERLRLDDDPLEVRLACAAVPEELVSDVLRIVQEGVTNVRRHAMATTCSVIVATDESRRVRITIEDDGASARAALPEGIGRASIRRRAERRGGWVEFASTDRGTRLTAVLHASESP